MTGFFEEQREPIYELIEAERERQDRKWGGPEHDDNHDEYDWIGLIQYQLNHVFACSRIDDGEAKDYLIQAAAVTVSMIETIDRRVARLNARLATEGPQ